MRALWLSGAADAGLGLDEGEKFVAGGQRGLAFGGQGCREAVGVGEFGAGVEFGGLPGEVVGGGDEVDGELGDFSDDFLSGGGTLGAVDGIVDFAPVD